MRKPLIAANWKMFLTLEEAKELADKIAGGPFDPSRSDVLLAPGFTYIAAVADRIQKAKSPVTVAAQNIHTEDSGAFTGEVSLPMVKSAGAQAVILGHSERRHIFGENDETINLKAHKVIAAGMTALICVGELLQEREAGVAAEVVIVQLGKSLHNIKELNRVIIAYEPVWAIGTGKTATAADAQDMHREIRAFLAEKYGSGAAESVRILYGGSVKPENITELMSEPDIDGALVGGASLKADQFLKIINY